jgi:hypothetical protein
MVVGDLHGHVENFRLALQRADLARQPRRHLVLQEIVHGPFAYSQEGGDKSHQLLDLVAALKCQFPARVHFLLGNHELAQWQRQRIGKGDVDQNEWFVRGISTAYGDAADAIYTAYEAILSVADLALRTANRIFISHSVPPPKTLETFSLAKLQTDPIADEEYRSGGAVHGLVWGRTLDEAHVAAFLERVDCDLLISGHIPSPEGFRVPNSRQLILDAIGFPAGYCLIPTDRPLSQEELLACVGTL